MTWFWVFRCAHILNVGVICDWHVGQTLQAKLNQSEFQCLLVSGQKSVRTREIRWKCAMVSFMRNGYVRPSSWPKNLSHSALLCIIMCLHPGPPLIRMSTVILHFLQLLSCYWFLLPPSCLCQIPLRPFPTSQSYSLLFHFPKTWYHCFPSSETHFNDELISPSSK